MYIFLARNNEQAGPYTLEQLNHMLSSGQVALDDLMWHEGMANWQYVGEMTNGQNFYHPSVVVSSPVAPADDDADYIINNTPDQYAAQDKKSSDVWDRYNSQNSHRSPQNHKPRDDKTGAKLILTKISKDPSKDISGARKQLMLAGIGSRILAKLIDLILFSLPNLILWLQIMKSPNYGQIVKLVESGKPFADVYGELNTLMTGALSALPQQYLWLSTILLIGIVFSQLFLLLRRGQTLGKMLVGIRILDRQSNAIPNFFNLIILRSVLTWVVYSMSVVGIIALIIDFVVMFTNADRQSLHDKIARTYVVRVDDTQTTPLEVTTK